jgi:hypothetical protein
MGLKVVIPGANFTDTTLPILQTDPLIVPGTLLLVDFGRAETHSLDSVPAHGAQIGNIAWATAAAVLGSGSLSTLSPTFQNTFVGAPTMGLVERTPKKGLHVITSQTAMDSAGRYASITLPNALRDYLWTNLPGRTIYTSVWGRHTRMATQGTDAMAHFAATASPTANYVNLLYRGALWVPTSGGTFVGQRSVPSTGALGNWYAAGAQNGWTGTRPGTAAGSEAVFWFGARGAYEGFQRNAAASVIVYRIYMEDLTTSGRTFSAVDAADKALYDAAFGSGGRFASDSFTAVATLP